MVVEENSFSVFGVLICKILRGNLRMNSQLQFKKEIENKSLLYDCRGEFILRIWGINM